MRNSFAGAELLSDLRHAGKIGFQHIAAQPVRDEFAVARRFDKACSFKLLHVVGDGGGADLSAAAQVLARERIARLADLAQQVVAARIGQRPGDEVKAVFRKSRCGHGYMLERSRVLLDSHKLKTRIGVC